MTKETWFYKGLELCINRLTDDEAAAKLLPIGAPGKCEGWEVGCLIDPGSEGDGEGMLLLSVVLDVWPALLKVDYLEYLNYKGFLDGIITIKLLDSRRKIRLLLRLILQRRLLQRLLKLGGRL